MSKIFQRLKAALPKASFQPPASKKQIERVEKALNVSFPEWLRELYLCCNGIENGGYVYLYALQKSDAFSQSLLSWNQFLRSEWRDNLTQLKEFRPEVNWDDTDPHRLIIIGGIEMLNWAIDPLSGPEILNYDVRNEGPCEAIAKDFVEACLNQERQDRDAIERLFRGREKYRDASKSPPASKDIDRIIDAFLAIQEPRNVFSFQRRIRNRPDEVGDLYALNLGIDNELRMVSRNGNFPFAFRLRAWPYENEFECVVRNMPDAIRIMLNAEAALSLHWTDANQRPKPDEAELRRIFRARGDWESIPRLKRVADELFARDDKRHLEKNAWGGRPEDDQEQSFQ